MPKIYYTTSDVNQVLTFSKDPPEKKLSLKNEFWRIISTLWMDNLFVLNYVYYGNVGCLHTVCRWCSEPVRLNVAFDCEEPVMVVLVALHDNVYQS